MGTTDTKQDRKKEVQSYKRQKILDAASDLFREKGLEGSTMRAIATRAGYSTGAPYAYFQSKEEIYAELLNLSLLRLTKYVRQMHDGSASDAMNAQQTLKAFYLYYQENADDLQLGLYLFSSGQVKKQGFSKLTNDQLNSRLLSLLGYMANSVHQIDGVDATLAQTETLDAVTYFIGALMLAETGRLGTMGANPKEMIDRYLSQMLQRVQ